MDEYPLGKFGATSTANSGEIFRTPSPSLLGFLKDILQLLILGTQSVDGCHIVFSEQVPMDSTSKEIYFFSSEFLADTYLSQKNGMFFIDGGECMLWVMLRLSYASPSHLRTTSGGNGVAMCEELRTVPRLSVRSRAPRRR